MLLWKRLIFCKYDCNILDVVQIFSHLLFWEKKKFIIFTVTKEEKKKKLCSLLILIDKKKSIEFDEIKKIKKRIKVKEYKIKKISEIYFT